jgi:protein gp37
LLLERARTASRCGIDHDRPDSASYRAREAAYNRSYYRKARSVRSAGTGCVTACTQRRFCSVAEAALSPRRALRAETTRLVELAPLLPWPSNVWMGVSIENRRFVHRADRLRQVPAAVRFISAEPLLGPLESLDLTGIHWLIAGGESGPRHRPVRAPWVRTLREQCSEADFFFKQWGGRTPKAGRRELDGQTWNGMPTRPNLALA